MSGSLSRIRLYAGTLTCARTDGVGVSSGGRDVYTRCPLARPFAIWGFTALYAVSAGALPPEFIYMGLAAFSYFGCFSALRLHVSAECTRFGGERFGVRCSVFWCVCE